MRKFLFALSVALTQVPSLFAALPAATVWEVRTATGADTNGGCFVAGSTGTDVSQQTAAQFSGTNLATTATSTVVTSATHTFAAADVGNCIHVTAGTGWTVGFYEIVSVASGQATLDRAPAAASTSGGTWAVGGALATPQSAVSGMTASNVIWVSGSISESAALGLSVAGPSHITPTAPPNRFIGYGTTRGDNGRFLVTMTGGASYAGINVSASTWSVYNVEINCNSTTGSTGFSTTSSIVSLRNAKISACTSVGANMAGVSNQIHNVEVTGSTGTTGISGGVTSGSVRITENWIHDNTFSTAAIRTAGNALNLVAFNLVTNNAGANADGIQIATTAMTVVESNTVYNSGRHGIYFNVATLDGGFVHDNLLVGNGGYGFVGASAAGRSADLDIDGNAYFNNALGTRSNADDTTVNPQNGVYTNTHDVILNANPFTNPTTNDFTLNAATGGGAALRGTALPGLLPGVSTPGYMDFGALSVQGVTNVTTIACQTTGKAYAQ